jgi:hypothetical protein
MVHVLRVRLKSARGKAVRDLPPRIIPVLEVSSASVPALLQAINLSMIPDANQVASPSLLELTAQAAGLRSVAHAPLCQCPCTTHIPLRLIVPRSLEEITQYLLLEDLSVNPLSLVELT